MTTVGHTLTGLGIGMICMPEKQPRRSKTIHLAFFGLLANVPDLPFPYWGHARYYISHSLFVALALMLALACTLAFLPGLRARLGGWPVVIGGACAWLSHLLLDTLYNNGKGLRMFWPLSNFRMALPIPWFSAVQQKPPPFTPATMHIFLVELAFYGSMLLLVILLRKAGLFHSWRNRAFSRTGDAGPRRGR